MQLGYILKAKFTVYCHHFFKFPWGRSLLLLLMMASFLWLLLPQYHTFCIVSYFPALTHPKWYQSCHLHPLESQTRALNSDCHSADQDCFADTAQFSINSVELWTLILVSLSEIQRRAVTINCEFSLYGPNRTFNTSDKLQCSCRGGSRKKGRGGGGGGGGGLSLG